MDKTTRLETLEKKVNKYHTALISMDKEYESKFIKKEELCNLTKAIEESIRKLKAIAIDIKLKPPDVVVSKEVFKLQKFTCLKLSGIP